VWQLAGLLIPDARTAFLPPVATGLRRRDVAALERRGFALPNVDLSKRGRMETYIARAIHGLHSGIFSPKHQANTLHRILVRPKNRSIIFGAIIISAAIL
jgi:hypothetical protein